MTISWQILVKIGLLFSLTSGHTEARFLVKRVMIESNLKSDFLSNIEIRFRRHLQSGKRRVSTFEYNFQQKFGKTVFSLPVWPDG